MKDKVPQSPFKYEPRANPIYIRFFILKRKILFVTEIHTIIFVGGLSDTICLFKAIFNFYRIGSKTINYRKIVHKVN